MVVDLTGPLPHPLGVIREVMRKTEGREVLDVEVRSESSETVSQGVMVIAQALRQDLSGESQQAKGELATDGQVIRTDYLGPMGHSEDLGFYSKDDKKP